MAAEAVPVKCTLQLTMDLGRDENDKAITRTRSYTNVKVDAGDEDIYAVGDGLANLQEHELKYLRKVVTSDLVDVG